MRTTLNKYVAGYKHGKTAPTEALFNITDNLQLYDKRSYTVAVTTIIIRSREG